MSALLALVGIAVGALLSLQGPINAQLARAIGSPVAAATVSFISGGLALCLISLALVRPEAVAAAWRASPVWLFFAGGLLGAVYVTTIILLVPRLGTAAVMGLSVAGQLIGGLLLDRMGAFGLAVQELTLGRVAGAALLVAGAVLVRLG